MLAKPSMPLSNQTGNAYKTTTNLATFAIISTSHHLTKNALLKTLFRRFRYVLIGLEELEGSKPF
jgi:hypothetical protein